MQAPVPFKALQSKQFFAWVSWPESKKAVHKTCIKMARRASFYAEKDGRHIVGFQKNRKDARLCPLFLNEVKRIPGYVCMVSGEPQKIDFRLINVLDCYSKGLTAKDQRAYCWVEDECDSLGFIGYHTDIETLKKVPNGPTGDRTHYICPCHDLSPFLQLSRRSGVKLIDQVDATSKRKKQALCPLFDLKGFRELLPEPKKYW